MRDPDEPRKPYDIVPEQADAAPSAGDGGAPTEPESGRLPVARLAPVEPPAVPANSAALPADRGVASPPLASASADTDDFVRDGVGDSKTIGIVGGVLALAAIVTTAINATRSPVAASFLTLYSVIVHAGTGVVAIMITAALADRKTGDLALAGARMLAAVAAGVLIFHLNITLFSTAKTEELFLGALVYALTVMVLFRMWGPRMREYLMLLGLHFVLWVIIRIGMELAVWAQPAAEAASGVAPGGPVP